MKRILTYTVAVPLAALLVCAAAAHALYTYTCKHYEITLWEGSGL